MKYLIRSEFKNGWNANSIEFDDYDKAKKLYDEKTNSNNYSSVDLLRYDEKTHSYVPLETYSSYN